MWIEWKRKTDFKVVVGTKSFVLKPGYNRFSDDEATLILSTNALKAAVGTQEAFAISDAKALAAGIGVEPVKKGRKAPKTDQPVISEPVDDENAPQDAE